MKEQADHSDDRYWNLMSRYLANDLTLEDTDDLLRWLDDDPARSELLAELRASWDKSAHYGARFDADTAAAWKNVQQRISVDAPQSGRIVWLNAKRLRSIAAALLVMLLSATVVYKLVFNAQTVHVTAKAGEKREVLLPDGSTVWLNEKSAISYAADMNEQSERKLTLHGEAFFDVTKDPEKQFVIHAGETVTRVLGTSFGVKTEADGRTMVSVISGKVSFGTENQRQVLLPNYRSYYDGKGSLKTIRYTGKNFLFWKNGTLDFDHQPLSNVLQDLEEVFGVKFKIDDQELAGRRITTSFEKMSLNRVIEVLEAILDIRITRSEEFYIVSKK